MSPHLFASDSTRRSVGVKSIVWKDIELTGSVAWLNKDYRTTVAFDADGAILPGVLRTDRITAAAFNVSLPLFPARTGPISLDLLTGYDFADHRSTSALYRYTAHMVRFGIAVKY